MPIRADHGEAGAAKAQTLLDGSGGDARRPVRRMDPLARRQSGVEASPGATRRRRQNEAGVAVQKGRRGGAAVAVDTRAARVAGMTIAVTVMIGVELGLGNRSAAGDVPDVCLERSRSLDACVRQAGVERMGRGCSREGDSDERQSQKSADHRHAIKRTSFATTVKRDNDRGTHHETVAHAVHACFLQFVADLLPQMTGALRNRACD